MRPIVLVKQFHKLSRTVEFDLFGFLNLEIFNFKVDISTENFREFKLGKSTVVDNVEIADMGDPLVSGTVHAGKFIKP